MLHTMENISLANKSKTSLRRRSQNSMSVGCPQKPSPYRLWDASGVTGQSSLVLGIIRICIPYYMRIQQGHHLFGTGPSMWHWNCWVFRYWISAISLYLLVSQQQHCDTATKHLYDFWVIFSPWRVHWKDFSLLRHCSINWNLNQICGNFWIWIQL